MSPQAGQRKPPRLQVLSSPSICLKPLTTVDWLKRSKIQSVGQGNVDWEQTWSRINEKYRHYADVHTINNTALIVLGGWDADCTGATAGSVVGMRLLARSLPDKCIGVFNDRLNCTVRESEMNQISDLARRGLTPSR